jgi:hypothetical protein
LTKVSVTLNYESIVFCVFKRESKSITGFGSGYSLMSAPNVAFAYETGSPRCIRDSESAVDTSHLLTLIKNMEALECHFLC